MSDTERGPGLPDKPIRPVAVSDTRGRRPRIPLWRWTSWWIGLAIGMLVFYVLLTPIWIGLRMLAWIAEFNARRRR